MAIAENDKSLSGCLWKAVPYNERQAEVIAQRWNLPFVVASILSARDVLPEDVTNFLEPKLQTLMPNPSVMKDVDKASSKIADIIEQGRKVGIIGDYDVDGATSSSVLRLFLESVGIAPEVHIPDRDEGYGPSKQAFDNFKKQGIDFVITTDCGTTAFEPFEYAAEQGFTVIVLDHHEAEVKLPSVFALVNPKRFDDDNDYPYLKYMSAVGVVFMTVVAVNRELRSRGFYKTHSEPQLLQWLDLVALGTICDVVPLKGLNRAFVRQGLKIMAQRQNIGLKALIDKAGVNETPSAYHLGYVLGPRINAGGRVGDPSYGNRLLCSRNPQEAEQLAAKLDEFNAQRKDIENYVLQEAIETLDKEISDYPIAFIAGHNWHQGVIGIVAGKLKERYNLPSFVMSIEEDEVKGSARSIPQVDLGALVIAAKEKGIITKGGGHTMAAGYSLNEDKIEEFRRFVGEYVKARLGDEAIVPVLEYDGVLDLLGATPELAEKLEMLEPFGAGNAEPKFVIKNVCFKKTGIVGSGHIRSFLSSKNGGSIKAMAFRAADNEIGQAMLNNHGEIFDVLGTLRRDTWLGRNDVQFIIDDVKRVTQ